MLLIWLFTLHQDLTQKICYLSVFGVDESISDMFTELPCWGDLGNLGQLSVVLLILVLITGTNA